MPRLRELWFDLPPVLEDVTEYFFTSPSGPILDLPLSLLPLAPEHVDAWLLQARDKLKSFRGVNLGELQSYDSPRYRVRGFEADFGSSKVPTVLVSVGDALAVHLDPKCAPGYEPQLREVLRSFRREDERVEIPPGAQTHAAMGFAFECSQPLEDPQFLSLSSKDGALRILGQASSKRLKRTRPEWASAFGLGPVATTTEVLQGRARVVGRLPQPPSFALEFWLAALDDDGVRDGLCWARAMASTERHHFRFELRGTGAAGLQQLDVFVALLQSARASNGS